MRAVFYFVTFMPSSIFGAAVWGWPFALGLALGAAMPFVGAWAFRPTARAEGRG